MSARSQSSYEKSRRESRTDISELRMSRTSGDIVQSAAMEIFKKHRRELLDKGNDFVIAAIWGTGREKRLEPVQEQIRDFVHPVVEKLLDILQMQNLDLDRRYALGFIIRDLILSKVLFMLELYKNRLEHGDPAYEALPAELEGMEVWGSA